MFGQGVYSIERSKERRLRVCSFGGYSASEPSWERNVARRISTTTKWVIGAFLIAALIAIEIRLTHGPKERIDTALRATARWSFVLFWLATTGSALKTLFGDRFSLLARHARDLGLSFASAHLVHLALVAWIFAVSSPQFTWATLTLFSVGVFWVYLLALLSFSGMAQRFGGRATRTLRHIGVEYINVAFFIDFNKDPFNGGWARVAYYSPFLILSVAGPLLRAGAALRKLARDRAKSRTQAA